jgi:hypothetical protein
MKISNKIESLKKIKELKLNQLPEKFFDEFNAKIIIGFLENNKAEYYAVRDKSTAMSPKHKLAVKNADVLNYCKNNKLQSFTINVSSYNYRENQICAGEICIHSDFTIDYILTNNPSYSVRDCYKNPDFKGVTDIFDKKIKYIKGFDAIIDYVIKYNLFDVIVEFTVFNCPIGANKENIIIWELRTDY